MSLLLCFFIMLFAISVIQEIKWEAFIETKERKMGYAGRSPRPSRDHLPSASLATIPEESRRLAAGLGSQDVRERQGEYGPIQSPASEGTIVRGGLFRFELGRAELSERVKEELEKIFPVLLASQHKIMVKAHVAPTEAAMGGYSHDYFLAHRRAANVKNHLISLGLDEEFFIVSMSDSATIPNRAILSEETNPLEAGASVAVYLLSDTSR